MEQSACCRVRLKEIRLVRFDGNIGWQGVPRVDSPISKKRKREASARVRDRLWDVDDNSVRARMGTI